MRLGYDAYDGGGSTVSLVDTIVLTSSVKTRVLNQSKPVRLRIDKGGDVIAPPKAIEEDSVVERPNLEDSMIGGIIMSEYDMPRVGRRDQA